jgi:hypothetical protein
VAIVALAHFLYGMPMPAHWLSLLIFVTIGIVSFRSIGLMIAAVVNSAQEGQIVTQLLYLPMLFLSGATFPLDMLPAWVQSIAQFLPASHLFLGIQGILVQGQDLLGIWTAVAALPVTLGMATFAGAKLFRWEKEEKISTPAKAWLAAVLTPFLLLGAWQAHSRENLAKVKTLAREMRRNHTWLIRDARILVGGGSVIESGAVLVKSGRIENVFSGKAPDPKTLKADAIEASGKASCSSGNEPSSVSAGSSGRLPVSSETG